MNAPLQKPMTSREFLSWVETQPDGKRYRLINGEPVKMAAERVRQGNAKFRAAKALETAIAAAGLPCHVLPDGITVIVDEYTAYEPDASVYCGEPLDDDAMVLANPLIVVEVLSPIKVHIDTGRKLTDYFRIPSVQHYLIIDSVKRRILRHSRASGTRIDTEVFESGSIQLEPPGMTIAFDAILPAPR